MDQLFPYANVIVGVLVLIVAFTFHWVGQLISLINWDFAIRIGLQEKDSPAEFFVYEHAIAVADVAIGWIYGIAGVGLIVSAPWGYTLAWFPGVVLIYHSISAWFWFGNQTKAGYPLMSTAKRATWCVANLVTGVLAVAVAWNAP
jgi:hypothetical protein